MPQLAVLCFSSIDTHMISALGNESKCPSKGAHDHVARTTLPDFCDDLAIGTITYSTVTASLYL